jgi:hypothetical protein
LTTGQAARVRGMDEYSGVMSVLPARHPVLAPQAFPGVAVAVADVLG